MLLHCQREVRAALDGCVVGDNDALLTLDDADTRDDPGRGGGAVVELPRGQSIQLDELPVAADLFRSSPSRPLSGDLRGAEIVSAEEAFLGSQVSGLMRQLAAKDEYTEGHTRRVALLAVEVGEELALPPARLRELATGGLLHDIGKLSVPDEVLKKPAALDDAEYALVQKHTVWGDALLGRLGFSPRIRQLVRDHHERLDGTGYPNGNTVLSLETRRPRRVRRLRRASLGPRLPGGVVPRACDRAPAGRGRHEVRRPVRRGAQPRARPAAIVGAHAGRSLTAEHGPPGTANAPGGVGCNLHMHLRYLAAPE